MTLGSMHFINVEVSLQVKVYCKTEREKERQIASTEAKNRQDVETVPSHMEQKNNQACSKSRTESVAPVPDLAPKVGDWAVQESRLAGQGRPAEAVSSQLEQTKHDDLNNSRPILDTN
jgi:hypothetical protein